MANLNQIRLSRTVRFEPLRSAALLPRFAVLQRLTFSCVCLPVPPHTPMPNLAVKGTLRDKAAQRPLPLR